MKMTLELGAWKIDRCIRVEDHPRLAIWFEEDDFGKLFPCMGLEDKILEHGDCDGHAAKIVQRDHRAIVSVRHMQRKPDLMVRTERQLHLLIFWMD